MQCVFSMAVSLLVFVSTGILVGKETYSRADLLVEPADLARSEFASGFVILDTGALAAYTRAHIPRARFVDHGVWAKSFGDGHDAEGWSKRIGELGIGNGSKVVIYDDTGSKEAARVWWILQYWGVRDVRLLNGGWQAWTAARFATETGTPENVQAVEFKAVARRERLADKQQMLDLVAGGTVQIVDARSEGEYCGQETLTNKKAGAMPGAKHLEWTELIDQQTLRFKSEAELRALFAKAGIDLAEPAACHCQTGGRSSVMVFAMELMGAPGVRNYYRGWSEWGNAEDTPVTVLRPEDPK